MTASQKPPAHTASPLFQKKTRRCQTRIHTSSSSAMDKASRAPRTATSPKSSVGIAAGSELGPTPSSPKSSKTGKQHNHSQISTVGNWKSCFLPHHLVISKHSLGDFPFQQLSFFLGGVLLPSSLCAFIWL